MKKNKVFMLMILLPAILNSTYGQADITTDAANKIVDTIIYRFTRFIATDAKNTGASFDSTFNMHPNEGKYYEWVKAAISKTADKKTEAEEVCLQLDENRENIISSMKKFTDFDAWMTKIFTGLGDPKLSAAYLTRKKQNSPEFQKELNLLAAYIEPQLKPGTAGVVPKIAENTSDSARMAEIQENIKGLRENIRTHNFFILALLVIAIGLPVVLTRRKKIQGTGITENDWRIIKDEQSIQRLKLEKLLSTAENPDVGQKEIPKTESTHSYQKRQGAEGTKPVYPVQSNVNTQTVSPQVTENKKIYFSIPDKNGFFRSESSGSEITSTSYYEFELLSPGKAHFKLIENQKVIQQAIASPADYLQPVCRMNMQPSAGKKIKRIQPGIAELQGGNWIVIDKSYIEFE